jgi:hypothetical protein
MNYCEVLIAIMFGVQMFTLFLLWEAVNDANHWKRNAIMRDPKTGRFIKRRREGTGAMTRHYFLWSWGCWP